MILAMALILLIALFQLWWYKTDRSKKPFNFFVVIFCSLSLIVSGLTLFYHHYKVLMTPKDERWTNRVSPVNYEDLEVLEITKKLLSSEVNWDKNYNRYCLEWENKVSLFCAIALAETEVYGKYQHHGLAIQHVRYTIDDEFPTRWSRHPIQDFSNDPKTSYSDIIEVLDDTILKIKKRLKDNTNS